MGKFERYFGRYFQAPAALVLIAAANIGGAQAAGAGLPAVAKLLSSARAQVGVTVRYDPAYVRLAYPMGDVPRDRGVCTDVVIRAYRDAFDLDLQARVHRDMRANFRQYPKYWGLKRPDRNIDHRRVLNLRVFFTRNGKSLPVTDNPADYRPGDIVSQKVGGNLPHIGVVAARRSADGKRPQIIHNIGGGTRIEDTLFAFPITGHYRYFPKSIANR